MTSSGRPPGPADVPPSWEPWPADESTPDDPRGWPVRRPPNTGFPGYGPDEPDGPAGGPALPDGGYPGAGNPAPRPDPTRRNGHRHPRPPADPPGGYGVPDYGGGNGYGPVNGSAGVNGSGQPGGYGVDGYRVDGYGVDGYGAPGSGAGYGAPGYGVNGHGAAGVGDHPAYRSAAGPVNGHGPAGPVNGYAGAHPDGYADPWADGGPAVYPVQPDRYAAPERPAYPPRTGATPAPDPAPGYPPSGYRPAAYQPPGYGPAGYPGRDQPAAPPARYPTGYVGPEAPPDDGGRGYAPPRPGQPGTYQDQATEVLRRYVPANEVLDREAMVFPATHTAKPSHPPRAVVRRRRARRRAMEWPFLVAFALVAAFLIRMFGVQTFYIPSGSMHETLLEGDRVLVNKVGYHLHDVHRGDVVVFRKPADFPVDEDDLIKRVVGLPGETVEGHNRKVFVNGRQMQEPYVEPACNGTDDFAPVTVPAGKLWVMGDNRCDSSDSRVFGPIDEHLIVGRAFVIVWPSGRLAWL